MSKELTNPVFDYQSVSKEEAGKLKYYEGQLAGIRKRVATEIINLGEVLCGAQQVLSNQRNGIFLTWLDSVGFSQRTAYNYIGAFQHFGKLANLQQFEVSALYTLTSNEKAKKKAIKLADKGVKVTNAMAQKLIEESKPTPKPPEEPEPPSPAEEINDSTTHTTGGAGVHMDTSDSVSSTNSNVGENQNDFFSVSEDKEKESLKNGHSDVTASLNQPTNGQAVDSVESMVKIALTTYVSPLVRQIDRIAAANGGQGPTWKACNASLNHVCDYLKDMQEGKQ